MADNRSVLSVSIVTPDGRVYEHDGELLVIKTKLGQLGIMPNHVPVISSLEVDEVRIKHDGEEDEVAVNGGFLEFSDNVATIVADSAERQDDIDVGRAESARDRAQAAIKKAQEEHDADTLARAEVALRRAINRINVANH
ncbi:F0F1 ATP synthase subunit epsilon [Levilactobacillus tujiorum]|uniref:ATP synthase epsilon chain n=1 Tax=Levilactobacillus tujiorum TaxID=2912243 RepID=A0ABX1L6U9_9LACO|nr:F0F1 ATP synthase subunit epsilon [Levilactobacillus tujiorum]MCH5464708.1 F0F1 ATP synthase subunit epsilon [Levilactobacillus tujiorum]NLR11812.1 F0F1 ATP synthase subunit epsilon [Lactobacillus sp. HBUAS51387]NLR29687.1 F0F1 ATP synthase subunit epsilon [Levilactobacillus tujiorum]